MSDFNKSLEFPKFCLQMNNLKVTIPMVLAPINIIGSGLVLRAIYLTPELNKISTFQFIANLTVSDIMLSLIGLPLFATIKLNPNLSSTQEYSIQTAYKAFFDAKRMVSVLTLISLSVDKVLACLFHINYNNYFTTFRAMLLIICIWVISLSTGVLNWAAKQEVFPGYTCMPVRAVFDVTEASIVFVCFIIIFSCNIYLILLSNLHQKQDREQRRETNSRARKIYEHYKSLKSLVLIICMFGIGLMPLVLYFLLQQFVKCQTLTCTAVWEYLNIIHYFDLNTRFIVYCMRFKSLYRCVLRVSGCNKLRRVRVSPTVAVNEKQENGAATMVDEKDG